MAARRIVQVSRAARVALAAAGLAALCCGGAFLSSCHMPRALSTTDRRKQIDSFAQLCLEGYYKFHPTASTEDGLHERDELLETLTRDAVADELLRLREELADLDQIDADYLTPEQRADAEVLRGHLRREIAELAEIRAWQRDPGLYVDLACRSVHVLATRDFAPLDQRLVLVIRREELFSRLFAEARVNLRRCPRAAVEAAIASARGATSYFTDELPAAFAKVAAPKLTEAFARTNAAALALFADYRTWLEQELLPRAEAGSGYGEDLYLRLLACDGAPEGPAERLIEEADEEVLRLGDALEEAAAAAAPGKPVDAALAELAARHPAAAELAKAAETGLEELRKLCIEKGLATVTSEVRCRVRPAPPWRRVSGVAELVAPGALETRAREGWFELAAPDPGAGDAEREEELGQHDPDSLRLALARAGYPGAYLFHLRLRGCPSRVRRVFGCPAFADAWAAYAAAGLADVSAPDPSARLARALDDLRAACLAAVELRLHTRAMPAEEAVEFLVRDGRMPRARALREVAAIAHAPRHVRGRLGLRRLLALRDEYRARSGAAFSTRRFNDLVLAQGSAPITAVRRFLLGDSTQ
ncbi:MAG: DUF885 family protein [Planctomycetes bacterium]|nr:DUF885 family protein [Planctomycetota bacterium]